MTQNYFTSRSNAQKIMRDNFYKRVSSTSDKEYIIDLYFNEKTSAAAFLKTYKYNVNKECDTLVEIFQNKAEAKAHYEYIADWLK